MPWHQTLVRLSTATMFAGQETFCWSEVMVKTFGIMRRDFVRANQRTYSGKMATHSDFKEPMGFSGVNICKQLGAWQRGFKGCEAVIVVG
jgi:hypothetical protein